MNQKISIKNPKYAHLRKKILQLGLFSLLVLFAWKYIDRSTTPPSQPTQTAQLSDTELAALAESLVMPSLQPPDETTAELAKFGFQLFSDTGFSANGEVSCATCHKPELSFTDGRTKSVGLATSKMNAPTLTNVRLGHWFFWDGRADSLEAQAMGPLEHPGEQGFSRVKVAQRIKSHYQKKYEKFFGTLPKNLPTESTPTIPRVNPVVSDEIAAFALATLGSAKFQKRVLAAARDQSVQPIEIIKNHAAFNSEKRTLPTESQSSPDIDANQQRNVDIVFLNAMRAIAAFERTIYAGNSPFDRFALALIQTKNSEASLNENFQASELKGLRLFAGKGQCLVCHNGPNFTDEQFHNIGLPAADDKNMDLGRAQGLITARADPFNCNSGHFPEKKQTESCLELGYLESENVDLVGAFKTPTLRQLKDSAPYGHDGRFLTLTEVLRHYSDLNATAAVGRAEATLRPIGLSSEEIRDLEAFLLSLQGDVTHVR
jgi:cytochrome c peroxidase